jgi:hypothetical protein
MKCGMAAHLSIVRGSAGVQVRPYCGGTTQETHQISISEESRKLDLCLGKTHTMDDKAGSDSSTQVRVLFVEVFDIFHRV